MQQVTVRAGDAVVSAGQVFFLLRQNERKRCSGQVMPECLTHSTLPWLPPDRPRCALVMRYHSQHLGADIGWPQSTLDKVSPNTRELLQHAHYAYTKGIARQRSVDVRVDVVNRSDDDAAGLLPPGASARL